MIIFGLLGAAANPAIGAAPALAAADGACAAPRFSATASADLLRLAQLDLTSFGLRGAPMAGLRIATSRSDTTGGQSPKSVADAQYVSSDPPIDSAIDPTGGPSAGSPDDPTVGPSGPAADDPSSDPSSSQSSSQSSGQSSTSSSAPSPTPSPAPSASASGSPRGGPSPSPSDSHSGDPSGEPTGDAPSDTAPTARARQEAPPAAEGGVTVDTAAGGLGALHLGTGTLTAHTPWPGPQGCAPQPGTTAEAAATLREAGPGDNAAGTGRERRALGSSAVTGLVYQDGTLRPLATAEVNLNELTLFGGTGAQLRVVMVRQPRLRVVAGHLPDDPAAADPAATPATDPTAGVAAEPSGDSGARPTIDYSAPALQVTLSDGVTRTLDSPAQQVEAVVMIGGVPAVLRLSLGTMQAEVVADRVQAHATALRVQLLSQGASIVDLGVGVLETAASGLARDDGLPVTGGYAGTLVGWGAAMLMIGAFLVYATRPRQVPASAQRLTVVVPPCARTTLEAAAR